MIYQSEVPADIDVKTAKRVCKCRMCARKIQPKEVRMVFEDVHVSPKIVDLHFCNACCATIKMFAQDVVDIDQ